MSVTPTSTVVAAFRDRWTAEQAMEALYNAGFSREQMQYVVPGTGSFFEGLKNLFTGANAFDSDLASNLNEMGLSNEEAQYYAGEYDQGNAILAVMTSGRDQEALNILGRFGAYNARAASGTSAETASNEEMYQSARPGTFQEGTDPYTQPVNEENPDAPLPQEVSGYTAAPFPAEVASSDTTDPLPRETANSDPTAPFPRDGANNPAAPLPEEVATDDPTAPFPQEVSQETTDQDGETVSEPVLMEVDEIAVAAVPDAPANVYMPSSDDLEEIGDPGEEEQANEEMPEIEEVEDIPRAEDLEVFDQVGEVPEASDDQASDDTSGTEDINLSAAGESAAALANTMDTPVVSEPDMVEVPESLASMDASGDGAVEEMDEPVTPAYPASAQEPQQDTALEVPRVNSGFSSRSTQLQQVLDEIQRTQQQLQDAKSQLEAMKQHEAEYTTARQQLQDLQNELQTVQAELQATKERLGLE